jgi:hypothetical protein
LTGYQTLMKAPFYSLLGVSDNVTVADIETLKRLIKTFYSLLGVSNLNT